jgi:S-adenosylmethionine synthetase
LKVNEIFDLRPYAIETRLKLRTPIYSDTAAYGHMGRTPEIKKVQLRDATGQFVEHEVETFTWEKLDHVDKVKAAFAL